MAFNQFRINVDYSTCDKSQIDQRLQLIARQGVPNYFGAQRFGINMSNLESALTRGLPRKQPKRGRILSAIRSYLFNLCLSDAISDQQWQHKPGLARFIFDDGNTSFEAEWEPTLQARLEAGEVHLAGLLPGDANESHSIGPKVLAILADNTELCLLLENARMAASWRAYRCLPKALRWHWQGERLTLGFLLNSGCYATSVLRECGVD